jgi:heme exporter protein CcmD
MAEFLAMGGYGVYVWSAVGLGIATIAYNLVSARLRMRTALENAALNAARFRNRPNSSRVENGNDS